MKKVTIKDIGGEALKDNAQYLLKDNAFGNNLILSSIFKSKPNKRSYTCLARRSYMFIDGEGEMDIDGKPSVKGGDVVCIEDGISPCLTQGT